MIKEGNQICLHCNQKTVVEDTMAGTSPPMSRFWCENEECPLNQAPDDIDEKPEEDQELARLYAKYDEMQEAMTKLKAIETIVEAKDVDIQIWAKQNEMSDYPLLENARYRLILRALAGRFKIDD